MNAVSLMPFVPSSKVPPRVQGGTRTGFTTGACAAAAARAATRALLTGSVVTEIETRLPNRQRVTFATERCESASGAAVVGVIKDGGDDPDCTHGAEIVATVELTRAAQVVVIRGGEGVATVTKPGLGLEVGEPAVNPVPRRNLTEMVLEELAGSAWSGAVVTLSVPGGEEIAKETLNARLGLIGGISILGTTGIVRPYSTAAFRASVVQAIDVARTRGADTVVLTTGGKSESYAMRLFPSLAEDAFVQVGDFVGVGLRHAARVGIGRAVIVGMIGKLSKMADGNMQTHAAGSEVSTALLAGLARELGGASSLLEAIETANTARHVLDLAKDAGLLELPSLVCREVVRHATDHVTGTLAAQAWLVDFDGTPLGHWPREARR